MLGGLYVSLGCDIIDEGESECRGPKVIEASRPERPGIRDREQDKGRWAGWKGYVVHGVMQYTHDVQFSSVKRYAAKRTWRTDAQETSCC